jgi:predicted kinase
MTRPTLIIVSGPPGSGKSTLATRLSQHLGLPHCARDAIKQGQAWHNAPLMETPQDAQLACNHAFREMVSLLLRHGVSHVCDAAFQHHVWQPFLAHWQPQACIKIIICAVDDPVRHQRLRQRLHAEPQRGDTHADAAYLATIAHHPPFQTLNTDYPTLVVTTHTPDYSPTFSNIATWVHADD